MVVTVVGTPGEVELGADTCGDAIFYSVTSKDERVIRSQRDCSTKRPAVL